MQLPTPHWSLYRISHPLKARDIESLLGYSIRNNEKSDIQELVNSITRLSYKFECPIKQLKETFFYSLNSNLEWNQEFLELLKNAKMAVEVPKEADEFGIKNENTGQYLLCSWIDERIQEIKLSDSQTHGIEYKVLELTGKTTEQILEEYDSTHTPLAPDLSKADNLENRIVKIAFNLTNYLGYYYRPLSTSGRYEALIYCCILLVKFRPDHGNEIFLSELCDRVFLLLADEIPFRAHLDSNEFFDLFNQRTAQWTKRRYPVASLFKAFYVAPFKDLKTYKDTSDVDPIALNRFTNVLRSMKVHLVGVFDDLGRDPNLLMMSRPDYLKQYGLTSMAINNLIGTPEPEPKPLIVNPDYSMYVDYEGFKCRISLAPIEKALYMLYLKHPEGINFKDLGDHRDELEELYMKITRRNDREGIEKTVSRIVDPYNNSINEKCARIKKAFEENVPQELVHFYTIDGEKGGIRVIRLPRSFIKH